MSRRASTRETEGQPAAPAGPPEAPGLGRCFAVALGILLAAYFVLGGLYLATVPFGHAPDEDAHFLYVGKLAHGELPVFRAEDRANFEAHQPPLAYLVALPAYALFGGLGEGEVGDAPRVAVRIVSLILGALVLLLVVAGTRLWLPARPEAALAVGAVAAFIPMRLAVFSSFSNDPLTEAIFCAVLLLLGLGLRDGFGRRRCLSIGVLIGLGLLTKTTCALLLPVALTALFLEWRRTHSREMGLNAILLAGIALAIGGPWLVRNVLLYGDPLAMQAFAAFFGDRATPEYFMSRQGLTFLEYLRFRVMPFTLRSFWGVFDHMNLWMGGPAVGVPGMRPEYVVRGNPEAPIYTALEYATYLLAGGAVAAGVCWWRRPREGWQRDVALAWGLCAALVGAAFLRFNLQFFQAQARYLYPAVLPIAAALAAGWLVWWPARARRIGAGALGVLLAALALYAWHGTLLRVFGKVGW